MSVRLVAVTGRRWLRGGAPLLNILTVVVCVGTSATSSHTSVCLGT
jgi:hypothetical protein